MSDARNLFLRTVSACVFVPVVLALVLLGSWALLTLVLLVAGRCSWEFFHLAKDAGYRPAGNLGMLLAMGLCLQTYFAGLEGLVPSLILAALICPAAALRSGTERYAANALLTLGGVIYLGLLGSAPLLIYRAIGPACSAEVTRVLVAIFLAIWLADSAAYFCGRHWGKKKLTPTISPGKTVVGFIGGIGGSLLPLLLHGFVPCLAPLELLGLLVLAGLGGQLGDLVESAIKRDFGVKDTPPLIPGHGGALDRFDSYFFAFPLVYLYLMAIGFF